MDDRVAGLDLGADDYLGKPFSLAELLARIRALLRRRYQENSEIHAGSIVLDSFGRKVLKDSQPIDRTRKEFSILEFLLHNLAGPCPDLRWPSMSGEMSSIPSACPISSMFI